MPLEPNFNFIDDMDSTNPNNSTDQVKESANHIRGVKNAVQGSFPNLGQTAVTLTAAEMNAIPSQFDARGVPIGGVIIYNGLFAAIPANWQLCDGTNGTPDMTDQFAFGTNTESELGNTGGSADSVVVNHIHPTGTTTNGDHNHSVTVIASAATGSGGAYGGYPGGTKSVTSTTNGNHSHTVTLSNPSNGVSGTGTNTPAYIKFAYIRRMS